MGNQRTKPKYALHRREQNVWAGEKSICWFGSIKTGATIDHLNFMGATRCAAAFDDEFLMIGRAI